MWSNYPYVNGTYLPKSVSFPKDIAIYKKRFKVVLKILATSYTTKIEKFELFCLSITVKLSGAQEPPEPKLTEPLKSNIFITLSHEVYESHDHKERM